VFASAAERSTEITRMPGRLPNLAKAVELLERDMIEGALQMSAGNISETARALGLTRRGLYLKMQRLGVSAARL
jgi:DNA-binding NtrC family response regulator